jgi:hypothetical protein
MMEMVGSDWFPVEVGASKAFCFGFGFGFGFDFRVLDWTGLLGSALS